ncbi:MAG: succinylglutamate desuccinylase/aspartoacylase family protein [Myxococcota bacterium]
MSRITAPFAGVSGVVEYQATADDGTPIDGPRVAIIARMHGNEPVGDGVLVRLASLIDHLKCGSIVAIRANERAASLDVRHTPDGTDMNRMWDRKTLASIRAMSSEQRSYEQARAAELSPILLACDAVLDLHSTSRPSEPFLVFRDDQRHATLARKLGVRRLVTGLHENSILDGGVASNVGIGPGRRSKRLGFTFEAGQHDAPGNAERAWHVTERLLAELGLIEGMSPPVTETGEVFEVVDRFRQMPANLEPYRFVGYEGGEPGGGRRGAPRQLHSFEDIEADEIVLRRGRTEVVRARGPFTMLMPAPTTAPGTDLYYVTQQRQGGLSEGVPRTDETARTEALAIERMLDLMADDEFERGSSWVAFDARRLFDLCGSIVARSLRLPPGHPHRQITVMGRGDAGGAEVERRFGHRYRQAMRAAVREGLPLERFQLLRGASLRWIEAMTSERMQALLSRRQARFDGQTPPVRLRVSVRQPHTASLLVAGNLDHALETGDMRHVRVALLVEAATVEPVGASARLRVQRTGIVSARREVVQAARALLRTLVREHRDQIRHGVLRDESVIDALRLDDDAIEWTSDGLRLSELRGALRRVQLRLWCDQLLGALPVPVVLPDEPSLGRWIARTMAQTGVLDPEAIRAMAVVKDGPGFVADPARIDAFYASVSEHGEIPALLTTPHLPPHAPAQPLFADQVDADELERWVGWKRFVRGVQVVPDTRGKDLDLAFTLDAIRSRLLNWFEAAHVDAADAPGEVMVVIAGDGLNPQRDRVDQVADIYEAHRRCLVDPNVAYLRIQHAQGTHLSWMRDFLAACRERPNGGAPLRLQLEAEHGATVNVVLVLVRDPAVTDPAPLHPLDGWTIEKCGVILADLERSATSAPLAWFTEVDANGVNQELLHFGRSHCEGLWLHGPPVAEATVDAFEEDLVGQIAGWIDHVRMWRRKSRSVPRDLEARSRWVAKRLGLYDARLARLLARHMDDERPALEAARGLWNGVPPWPGERGFVAPAPEAPIIPPAAPAR